MFNSFSRSDASVYSLVMTLVVFFGILAIPFTAYAQTKDAEIWKGITLEREFFDKLKFEVSDQVRLSNNLSTFKSNVLDLKSQYKITKEFRVAAGYRFTLTPTNNRNRISADFVYKKDIEKANLEFTARARTQHEYVRNSSAINIFRPKLTLAYTKKKLDIEPFVSTEVFYRYTNEENEWRAYRFFVGFNYDLAKKNKVKLAYFYQKELNEPNPANRHVIQLIFSVDLTEKKKKKDEKKD
ncbi:MAG: DUF2490 domain-containing protein [Bacteroidota bacterium]